ncbi:DUF6526 family protein [Paenibacillus allorhizosphaerae]|uniref:ABC transporter permease n=1 Tax=Paenibacillus allorhizosphaerae TaxID=2849866 RepID=A0ABM8VQZ8_9BACL|nr:DUF6526 family protein [Paenibacillus allorhizosphaerae]CAG7654783.1 hypothetical protein PAECIP111802_05874 [Paenibacillus allorhizosphaerae]
MSKLQEQSYRNHKMFSPLYHFGVALVAPIVWIASIVYLIMERFSFASILLFGLSVSVMLLTVLVRLFATKLQDRIIRQEENFRHFVLTNKPLDARLSLNQIIALRFAEDDAFPALCLKAAETGMQPDEIKKSITHWRADQLRV